jgi:hypothetical protein
VKIYRSTRTKAGGRCEQFDVADYSSGRRKFIAFADEQKAWDKAKQIAEMLTPSEAG